MRTRIIIYLAVLICVSFTVGSTQSPRIDKAKIKESALINYPHEFNYRQTVNDCAPFNTAAVVRSLTNRTIDSIEFSEKIKWRFPNKYTHPWGLEVQLENNGLYIQMPNLRKLTDRERLLYLREQLSLGRPVIILGGRNGYQHYVTIFGFDSSQNEFYIYDSLKEKATLNKNLTIDKNHNLPGNTTWSSSQLLSFWQRGGMYGLYNWYAISASSSGGR